MPTFVRGAIGATLIGALVVACGGGTVASNLPSIAVPSFAVPSLDLPTLPTGTLNPDQSLEDLFPDTIGGQPVQVRSAQGESVRAMFPGADRAEFDQFLSRINTSIDQVSAGQVFMLFPIASGSTEIVGFSITALKARNAPAEVTLANVATLLQQDVPGSVVGTDTIGGKGVTTVIDPEDARVEFLPLRIR